MRYGVLQKIPASSEYPKAALEIRDGATRQNGGFTMTIFSCLRVLFTLIFVLPHLIGRLIYHKPFPAEKKGLALFLFSCISTLIYIFPIGVEQIGYVSLEAFVIVGGWVIILLVLYMILCLVQFFRKKEIDYRRYVIPYIIYFISGVGNLHFLLMCVGIIGCVWVWQYAKNMIDEAGNP